MMLNRNFKLLWFSRTISVLGDWMLDVTLPVWIYNLTGSVALLSVVLAVSTLPSVLLSPFIGALVDRWSRKTILTATNILLGLSTLALLMVENESQTWIIICIAIVNGIVSAFLLPAQDALLPEIVQEEHRQKANSMMVMSLQSMRFAGPALAGLIIATFGVRGAIVTDVLTFGIALVCCLALKVEPREIGTKETNLLSESWDGLKIVLNHPSLNTLTSVWTIMMFAGGMISTTLVVFLQDTLGVSEEYYGYTLAVQGAGMFAGGILMMTVLRKISPIRTFTGGLVLFSILLVIMANSTNIIVTMVSVAIMGTQMAFVAISNMTLIQHATQSDFRGRVMALNNTLMSIGTLVGITLAGVLITMLDARLVFNIAAGMACLSTAIAVLRATNLNAANAPQETAIT
jgi:MFS family permease